MNLQHLHEDFEVRDGVLYRKRAAGSARAGDEAGTISEYKGQRYKRTSFRYRTVFVHRVIFMMAHGYLPKVIDHANGDSLDNRIENLREATQSQNVANARRGTSNSSGRKGVTWSKESRKWRAQIMVRGNSIYLGLHRDIEAATAAYDAASRKHFGDFARNNQGGAT